MGDTTDELRDLANQVSPAPPGRELDMLLTAGERISMALLAMAIANLGLEGRSFTGSQAGVITDSTHGKARIIDITPGRIQAALDDGAIPIVAGFQGVSQTTKDITTLGRGASDTTAVALAAALGADYCEIFTDVDGIFTADPRIVPARSGSRGSPTRRCWRWRPAGRRYSCCGAWSTPGATRSRSMCGPLSATGKAPGSLTPRRSGTEGEAMEQAIISGVAQDRGEAKITVVGVPDKVGEAARIFRAIAESGINIDMIVQNVSAAATGRTDISFTLPRDDGHTAMTRWASCRRRSASTRCSTTTGSARSQSSAQACDRIRASARPSSAR